MSNETDATSLAREDATSNVFHCPQCDALLQFNMHIRVKKVRVVPAGEVPSKSGGNEARRLMEEAGLWTAFADAVRRTKVNGGTPTDIAATAAHWLEKAGPLGFKVPPPVMNQLIEEFGPSRITIIGWQFVAAIITDGRVRIFVPLSLLKGESFSRITSTGAELSNTRERINMPVWIRSKFGYVTGNSKLSILRKGSFGAFDDVNVSK